MVDDPDVKARFEMLAPFLNERTRRLAAAAEASAIGRGGIARVSRATGVSRRAIASGLDQLKAPDELEAGRIRRPGGGRKRAVETDTTLRADLERLIDPVPEATRSRPCGGRARVSASWPRSSDGWGTSPAIASSPICSMRRATASRPTARRLRARATPI